MDFDTVAARFVDECLRSDGSLFLPGRSVWTQAHVEDLYRRFVDAPGLHSEGLVFGEASGSDRGCGS